MTPLEKLKAKPPERLVQVDGVQFLVRGSTRSETAQLVAEMRVAADKDAVAMAKAENRVLARSVLDPQTKEPLMPNPEDWAEVAKATSEPLIDAYMSLDNNQRKEDAGAAKKLHVAES